MSHTDKDEQLPEGRTDVQDIAEDGFEDKRTLTELQEKAGTYPMELFLYRLGL